MKLHKKLGRKDRKNCINISDMKDGQVAIIRYWSTDLYIGMLVQRCGDSLIRLGHAYGESWPRLFTAEHESLLVEILPAGTLLEV